MVCRPGFENDPLEKIRHSAAHVLADAVVRLFPEAKPTIGPVIENGFYYDFYYPPGFTEDDLAKIEAEMKNIIKENLKFEEIEMSREQALEHYKKLCDEFKIEIINGLPKNEKITFYKHGAFVDLCKGPHTNYTKKIKAIKLLSIAGAYWRGDETKPMLQRIYGTAFESKEDLDHHLELLEEAKKRDHRRLGRELELFHFHKEAPASPFFYPKGAILYNNLVNYIRAYYRDYDYTEVITPQIFDSTLWHRSGHFENYKENMYFTEIEGREFAVKPMNCPGHCLMFGEKRWSYRELPIRYADFGRLHRYERSGVTHGITRVRTFSQDDAHIFCRPDQMKSEISNFLKLVEKIYQDFGFEKVSLQLSTRPEKYMGSSETWERSEKLLAAAMKENQIEFTINAGDGAFYGPKIDFLIKDALGRDWQLGTLQVDYSMPEKFDLKYVDENQQEQRPVMLHRAILGSLERFIGILVEHNAGAFPFWLAPEQMRILTISEEQQSLAVEWQKKLKKQDYRVEVDLRNEKLGLKIREAQVLKVPYMLILGKNEAKEGKVAVRHRKEGDLGAMSFEKFFEILKTEKNPMENISI